MAGANSKSISTLLQQSHLDDPEEALKLANESLKKTKSDVSAQHIKIVALLKLERYSDALRFLETSGENLKLEARLEWAYALYRNGDLEKALEVASERSDQNIGLAHVHAQAAYKLGRFEEASRIYEELGGHTTVQELDFRINKSAIDSQLVWAGLEHLVKKSKPDKTDLERFETVFNMACGYIARGELKQAELLLGRAKDLCNATDELSENDKKAELLPILIQQVYVLSRLGRLDEADKLCANIEISNIPDPATKHIAQVNSLVASSSGSNPFLSQRLFQTTSAIPIAERPFAFQSSILRRNSLVLDLQAGKFAGVLRSSSSFVKGNADRATLADAATAGVFGAAAKGQNQVGKAALKEILPLLESRPRDIGLVLTIVQLYVLTHNLSTATSLVESLLARLEASTETTDLDTRYAPGLVAVLVSLYSHQNRSARSKAELAKAASYWRHKSKITPGNVSLLKAAGTALVKTPTTEDLRNARNIFSTLYQDNPEDPVAIAGMVASVDVTDVPDHVASLAGKLPSTEELIAGIDVSALEEAGVPQVSVQTAVQTTKKRAAQESQSRSEKPKRTRPSRLPKDFDPNKKLDPERWLPLRDRSYYKPKGKKKGKNAAALSTQGGVVVEDGNSPTPNQQVTKGPISGGTTKAKKKKGKGGK